MGKELEELLSDLEEVLDIIGTMIANDEGLSNADIFRLEEVIFRHKTRVKNGDLDEIRELPKSLERIQDEVSDLETNHDNLMDELRSIIRNY
jgi:DNA repair exonuclease SbcCD ATPase subunit